jgi:hypothetical protein
MWGPTQAQTMGYVGVGAGIAGGVISSGLTWNENRIRAGGYDALGMAGNLGTGAGAVIGGGIGALVGGAWGAAAGAAIGGSIGGGIARNWMAPTQNLLDSSTALAVLSAESNDRPGAGGLGNFRRASRRVGNLVNEFNDTLDPRDPLRLPANGGKLAGAVYAGLSESMLAGGINPFDATGDLNDPYGTFRPAFDAGLHSGKGLDTLIGSAGTAIVNSQVSRQSVGDRYFKRLTRLFGNNIDQGLQMTGDVFASLPETGGNMADILNRFGATKTLTFNRLSNDDLSSPVSIESLASSDASIRGATRAATIGRSQIRGSGSATATALNSALETISGLPGGRDSMEYAQTRRSYVDALYSSQAQQDVTGFNIPSMQLSGREQRLQLLPFSPGNTLGYGLQRLNLNRGQIGVLQGRLSSLRSGGNLSEEMEQQLTGQIEDLRTQNAGVISRLSEGMEDRLPAMSSGAPAFAGRYSSVNLAALNLAQMGSPIRAFGATNGRQLAYQRAFIHDLGGEESDVRPRSRTQGMDSDLATVLSRLSSVLEKFQTTAPSGMRPGEGYGSAQANLDRQSTGWGGVWGTSN